MTVRRKSSDVELSVSRINRLLRPLRNKCAILASATSHPSGSAVPITYGSTSLETRAPPPLDVLHEPKLIISRAHQESRSLDTQARQIYAVTNAYHNVVQAALSGGLDGSRRDVLALTDICAASIGRNIKGEVTRCLKSLEEESDEDDAEETALVDELYESVPARFRSWTLIAHATSEIVDTCPSHPMLMLSLLGVALTRGLYAESKTFLRIFLATLIRSHHRHSINPPPIAHPMHPSYLVDLCNEWTSLAPECCAGSFTRRSFAAVTLEVLMEHGSAAAWTCKSITRLVQLLRTRDFECFLTFLHGLIETLAGRPRYLEDRSLLSRLAKWTGVITSDFFSSSKVGDGEQSGAADEHQLHSIVEILASAYDSGLHLVGINDDGTDDMRDPQAALVCAATHCLFTTTTPLISSISSPRRHAILTLLQEVSPSSTIYDALADLPLPRLRSIAGALRAHNLSSLERALWTCAVERSRSTSPVVEALLAGLVDAVEWGQEREQEKIVVDRTTRRGASATSESTSTGSPPRKRERTASRPVLHSHLRIHSPSPSSSSLSSLSTGSPPRKRARCERTASRRVSHSHPRIHSPSPSPCPSSSSSLSMTTSVAPTPSLSSSSARSLSESPVPAETAETSEDEEMTRRRSRRVMRFRSCIDLRSVLADALRERKDLKEERRRASLRSDCCYGRSVTPSEGAYSFEGKEGTAALTLPGEGDVLDLFAYEDPI